MASLAFLAGACAGAAPANPDAHVGPGSGGAKFDAQFDRYVPPPACGTTVDDLCDDFPTEPIIDTGAPTDAPTQFSGTPDTSGGPCIYEPEPGALFPNNWLRPRIRWEGVTAGTLVQIKFECEREKNPLVVYTVASEWKMDKTIWNSLRSRVQDSTLTTLSSWINVTVWPKGGKASTTKFLIAPVDATGSMVFWAADPAKGFLDPANQGPNDTQLLGFAVGDEGTAVALTTGDVKMPTHEQSWQPRAKVKCIGCHTSTPDGKHVGFTDHWPWPNAIAAVDPALGAGAKFAGMTPGGEATVAMTWLGISTFSAAHWSQNDYIMVAPWALTKSTEPWETASGNLAKLAWIQVDAPALTQTNGQYFPLEGQQFGFIARNGEPAGRGAGTPSWSHNGLTIAYASTAGGNRDGRLEKGATDIYLVPYNNKAGGDATPLQGAATTTAEEYYPAWSPTDDMIAFTFVPSGEYMYGNEKSKIAVVPSAGGDAVVLAANNPPACFGRTNVNNHWPKWSPEVKMSGNRTYYWIIFSSNRFEKTYITPPQQPKHIDGTPYNVWKSQLFMTGVMRDENGTYGFPAVYLWNQPTDKINLTPAWDTFTLPPVP